MPKSLQTPDRLFDRTWRPGHPFRPRISLTRRWAMGSVFVVLCMVIWGYAYITDSIRVGEKSQQYLSELLGGPVQVGDATLSIFEGLRLDDVKLFADDSRAPGSLLFSAKSFLIQYNPRALLSGKIEATQIIAVEPRVHVTEDADTGRRNYSRLLETRAATPMPTARSGSSTPLPAILLRNAEVDYTRIRSGKIVESSSIGIDGQLTPDVEKQVYAFQFQSRGGTAGLGPMIYGHIVMGSGQIAASLQNFEFGADVRTMLPPDVRRWWDQHELTGRVSVPLLNYNPPSEPGGKAGYRVELELRGVTLAVHPEEWMGDDEHRTLENLHDALDALRIAGLNGAGFVDRVAELVEPGPVNLKQVHGRFIFADDESIQIEDLNGWLEEVPFKISGRIKGYTPSAEAQIHIASSDLHDIEIPAAPRYLNSLPPAVREIYDRFKPRGVCRFWADLNRPSQGARPRVTGQIDIIDGNFTFDKFPYPLRKTTGRILLTQDPTNGEESLRLEHIRGRGVEGGPNANSIFEIQGTIGPFGPDTRVDVIASGQGVSAEPPMIAAFPPETRQALKVFDAPGKGEFPKFSGDFACNIIRLRGIESHWIVTTSITLDQASGIMVGFPYPMSGVSGQLMIRDDNLELTNISMKKGDATLRIDGRVSWPHTDANPLDDKRRPGDDEPVPKLKPNLRITAKDVPIDRDLLNALPPERRAWLEKIGVGGKLDIEGTIKSSGVAAAAADDLDIDLRMDLHDGTLWPVDGQAAVSNVEGNLRLTNQRLTLSSLRGRRGDADVSARGEISWPSEPPKIALRAEARDLLLDPALYKLLPESVRAAWDEVRPVGSIDATVNYSGAAAKADGSSSGGGYEIVLTPRKLTATPRSVPFRLDDLAGSVNIMPSRVVLKDLTAKHGDAKVRISATGYLGQQQPLWDFKLAADDVPVDDDFRNAVPKSLADLLRSAQMNGRVSFEFSKLSVAMPAAGSAANASPDVNFALKLNTNNGASLDVGVVLSDVKATGEFAGSSRNGKLWELTGRVNADSMTLAGRPVTRFHADLLKPPGKNQLTIGRIEGAIARGSMAGQVDWGFSDTVSQYKIDLTLRNADVRELAGEADSQQDIQGQLSASFGMEGTSEQPQTRRGRGVVDIVGDRMYKIPLVLGLLQITNLSLPITSPFTQASAKYSITGNRVSFEQIELRSKEMLMSGEGSLDFDSKQVRMKFVTDAVAWLKLPFIGDLLEQARHELLQIQVRGTLQEPKVSAHSMNTLTTTVDEVFKGEEKTASSK